MEMNPEALWRLAEQASALGDPTRLQVALALYEKDGALSVSRLVQKLKRDQGLISRHCKKLHTAGLVSREVGQGFTRYKLNPRGKALVRELLAGGDQ